MGKRAMNNFTKRFGNPPRIEIKFDDKPLDPLERRYRNKRIFDAFKAVLTGILGREPTHDELIGRVSISKAKIKKAKTVKPPADYQI